MSENVVPEYVHKAREAALLAEARKNNAEALETEARARFAEIETASLELDWVVKQEAHRLTTNSDHYHRVIRFSDDVNSKSAAAAIETMTKWSRLDPTSDMTIVFTSPGGSVFSGYALFDQIIELRAKGHHIRTVARGYAASMAGILLQAGSTRAMGKESFLMLHEISTMTMGKAFEIKDEADFLDMAMERMYDIFVSRAAEAFANGTATKKLTKNGLRKLVERRDYWVPSNEALELGLVDEVEG